MGNRSRRWIYTIIGILLGALIFLGPNWISPGLGCFLAFLVGVAAFAWELATGQHREFHRKHVAALAAFREGYWMICEANCRQSLLIAEKLRTKRPEALLAAGVLLTSTLMAMRRTGEAHEIAGRILDQVPKATNPKQTTGLAALYKIRAQVFALMFRLPEAEAAARQCAEWANQGTPTAHHFVHDIEAELCRCRGDYSGTFAQLRILEQELENANNEGLGSGLLALWVRQCVAQLETFHPDRALLLVEKALAHPDLKAIDRCSILSLKGYAYSELNRPAESEAAYQESLEICRRYLPPNDSRKVSYHLLYGDLHARNGDAASAAAQLAEVERFRNELNEEELLELDRVRGSTSLAAGLYPEAEAILREALQKAEARTNPHHPHLAEILAPLAASLEKQGRAAEAASFQARQQAIREAYANVG